MNTKAELVKAFRRLTDTQRGNLLYHLQAGTKILCGRDEATFFTDGNGGG